jgi:hypothetical protein
MTKAEMQAEALERARASQAFTNYPAIYQGFMAKGIAEADIKPRDNVLTFHAWKALGRSVKRGEHGVRIVTFIDCSANDRDPATGEEKTVSYRRPHTTTVFHISQTEPTSDRQARQSGYRTLRRSAWASGHGRYPSIDPGPRANRDAGNVDPGELAGDRWAESR